MRKVALAALVTLAGCTSEQPAGVNHPDPSIKLQFTSAGSEVFQRVFTDSTGLGPLFNGVSCAECHENPLGGSGDEIERINLASDCTLQVLHEFPTPEIATNETQSRATNDLFGLGKLDQLTDQEIRDYVASEPRNLGFIDGRYWFNVPTLVTLPSGKLGRFGRKLSAASLDEFSRGALHNEMGIEPDELSESDVLALVDFVANLTRPVAKVGYPHVSDPRFGFKHFTIPPGRSKADSTSIPPSQPPDSIQAGRAMFASVGCAMCHNPQTSYTDLAAHELVDIDTHCGLEINNPLSERQFRTEPLIGLGLQTRFMHDGSSPSLSDAIAKHGNEAGFSRATFNHLRDDQKAMILAFLRSL